MTISKGDKINMPKSDKAISRNLLVFGIGFILLSGDIGGILPDVQIKIIDHEPEPIIFLA